MGKFSLLLSLSVVGAVTILAFQGNQTSVDTSERQSRRQGQVIARQIARSGYNAVLSEAHQADGPDKEVREIVTDGYEQIDVEQRDDSETVGTVVASEDRQSIEDVQWDN